MLHTVERIGSFAGLASFLGLAVFALLLFAHGRDIRRLRDWAGSAPEREQERMEATQNIAAQRAEELRELEESKTAEHDAIADREIRRQRREEGLPEQTRGERFRERFSGFGESLSRPALLGGAVRRLRPRRRRGRLRGHSTRGSDSSDAKTSSKTSGGKEEGAPAATVKPGEIEVAVLNGTSVTGLAASWGDKIENKGFELGAVTNTNSTFEESVVMFEPGAKPEAKEVAERLQIKNVEPMIPEVAEVSNEAKVSVVVGEDNAAAEG